MSVTVTDKGKAAIVAARLDRLAAAFSKRALALNAAGDFSGCAYWQCGAAAYKDAASMLREAFTQKTDRAPLVGNLRG